MAIQRTIPTDFQLLEIPLAKSGEYELSQKEIKKVRARVYSLNKNNAAGRRWRTLLDSGIPLVWRVR